MRETGVYVGQKTAMAATARGAYLRHQLGSGPLAWLGIVAAVLTGRKIDGIRETDPETVQWCRGFLAGNGYDPDTHTVSRNRGALVVRDHVGDPVKAFSPKMLKALRNDPEFNARFNAEVDR